MTTRSTATKDAKALPCFVRPAVASDLIGVTPATLKSWARKGLIDFIVLPGSGHRRYDAEGLLARCLASAAVEVAETKVLSAHAAEAAAGRAAEAGLAAAVVEAPAAVQAVPAAPAAPVDLAALVQQLVGNGVALDAKTHVSLGASN